MKPKKYFAVHQNGIKYRMGRAMSDILLIGSRKLIGRGLHSRLWDAVICGYHGECGVLASNVCQILTDKGSHDRR